MTSPETPTEPAETPADGLAPTDGTADTPETATEPEGSPANREAAKYRRQLREAQAELEAARATVTQLRTAAAESVLTGVLVKPDALWNTGRTAAEFFDDTGKLDADALRQAAEAAVSEHGLAAPKRFQGSGDGGARLTPAAPKTPSWSNVFGHDD